jgi:hypothetical protein
MAPLANGQCLCHADALSVIVHRLRHVLPLLCLVIYFIRRDSVALLRAAILLSIASPSRDPSAHECA